MISYHMRKLIKRQNENEERHKMHKFVMRHNLPQIARPKTETMQYIVLFSHLTVQLPVKYLF